jgi:hypothetical protein
VCTEPIGRDAEIAAIYTFLSATSGTPAAILITGDPGIGKTTVWKHVAQAVRRSSKVLSCQPALADRPLAFSALDDLLGDVAQEVLPALEGPRRRALEVALLRDTSLHSADARSGAGQSLPERRVLARGVLDVLSVLSRNGPLVVAVDDVRWLDRPSAGVLEFCFRRLQHEPVTILLTFRNDRTFFPLGLDRALPPDRLSHVQLGPLSLGATGEILRSQLGTALPRYALTRLYEACGGNPCYALESARALLTLSSMPRTNEPIPVPQNLCDLVRHRVGQLTDDVRCVGQVMAAAPDPRERLIRAACNDQESWSAIDQAIEVGLIERDGERLRFTHPLLRSVLYAEMTSGMRRHVHLRLAAATGDAEARAWVYQATFLSATLSLGSDPGTIISDPVNGPDSVLNDGGAPYTR